MTELTDATFYAPLTASGTPTNGSGTYTFTRATAKKVINSAGVLESVTSGNLAINSDYGVHIDPASKTNNLLYCRDLRKSLSGGGWVQSGTIGSEMVANGNFATDIASWTGSNATLAWVAGELEMTLTASPGVASQNLTLTVGKTYVATAKYRIAGSGGTNVVLNIGNGASANGTYTTSTADITTTIHFTCTGATVNVGVALYGTTSTKAYIDSISVKEAAVQVALTQTGIDGLANSCSLLTAVAADAIILQTITAASTPACSGFWVKRSVGTGSVYITRDGGSNWTDITSLINSSTFTCVKIENTSVTNPQVGFKIATSGDAIIVDAGLNHAGTQLCEPILTTTAAVTRNAEVLTYQTSGNFSDTAGTVLATFRPTYDTWPAGSIVGKASFGLLTSTANSGVQAADGTNTVSGLSGTPTGQRKIGARWSGSSLQAFYETNYGAVGSYDGSFNLSTIAINPGAAGYIRDVAIFDSSLSDVNINSAWALNSAYILLCDVGSYNYSGIACSINLSRNLLCDVGSYNYSGIACSINLSRNLLCDVGIYNYSGIACSTNLSRNLLCDAGSYNYSGIACSTNLSRNLLCDVGSYNYSGIACSTNLSRNLLCDVGSYNYSGIDLPLQGAFFADETIYSLTPAAYKAVSITYTPIITTSEDYLTTKLTTVVTTPALSVDITGVGSTSTNINYGGKFKRVKDSVHPTENTSISTSKVLNDITTVSDLPTVGLEQATRVLVEATGVSESRIVGIGKNLTDTKSISEVLSKTFSTSLIDSATVSDTYVNSLDKLISVLATIYEGISTTANTEDLILREDGSLILRENGEYFIRETANPGTLDDNSAATDSLSILVENPYLDSLSSLEIINLIASKIIVEQALVAESLVSSTEKIVSDSTNSIELLTHAVEKILAETVTNTESATLSPNYALPDTAGNSENIACNFSKLIAEYATNSSITETVSTGSLAQDYILREDGSFVLREDGTSFITRESLTPTTATDTLGTTELMNFSASKSFIDANITTSEVVVASLSDFLLKEDNSSLILREDGSNFIRES